MTLTIAVCVAVLFAFLLNGAERTQQAYQRAQVCTGESTADCVILLGATISGKADSGGKDPRYSLTLDGPAPASGQIILLKRPIWDGMNVGDYVTATVWNGQVVCISDGAVSGDTFEAPSLRTATYAALVGSSVAWVLAFALFGVRVWQARRGRALGWSRALIPLNPVAGLGVFLVPFGSLAGSADGSPLVAVLSGVGLSVVAGSYFVVNWIRKRQPRADAV